MALSKIQSESINLADTYAFTGSVLTPGHVVQVQSTSDTSTAAMSNAVGTWADVGSLSVNITPNSTSNKIMVLASVCAGQANSNPYALWFRLLRDATPVGVGSSSNTRSEISFAMIPFGTYIGDDMGSSQFSYLDSPSTTSQITYKIQGASRANGDWAYNMSDDQDNNPAYAQGISTITVMEIAQ
jgi:hypothetical protein